MFSKSIDFAISDCYNAAVMKTSMKALVMWKFHFVLLDTQAPRGRSVPGA